MNPDAAAGGRIERLKLLYLECERAARRGRPPAGEAMGCSIIYERLKQRAFGGDAARMRAWLRAETAGGSAPGAERQRRRSPGRVQW